MNYKKACLQHRLADNTPRCSVLRLAGPLWGTASELAFYGIENIDSPASKMKTQNRELSINRELEFQTG
ncbi:hypothetical protein IX84_31940 [Phaeodactylibacter xiamenensis]|uniref:Uncharacterized protein n=1 Tax=Phaeodactylibacter xiamenensis TaxID=1524460 RepID=A0A098RX54_9BACT|nr:hypothetical protein IX84_31940 [Phaeodactylibacter xiamenensis]